MFPFGKLLIKLLELCHIYKFFQFIYGDSSDVSHVHLVQLETLLSSDMSMLTFFHAILYSQHQSRVGRAEFSVFVPSRIHYSLSYFLYRLIFIVLSFSTVVHLLSAGPSSTDADGVMLFTTSLNS